MNLSLHISSIEEELEKYKKENEILLKKIAKVNYKKNFYVN